YHASMPRLCLSPSREFDAYVDRVQLSAHRHGEGERPHDALVDLEASCGRVGDGPDEDPELVPAHARHEVAGPHALAQPGRDGHEELVTDAMAEAVVDGLEIVDV